ncbi:unnamed protein product, partial [Amoebophrya sp. A25]
LQSWSRVSSAEQVRGLPQDCCVRRIACGESSCFLLLASARETKNVETGEGIYSWGRGSSGTLGHGNNEDVYSVPRRVSFLDGKGVVVLSLGERHSCALTVYGLLYSWGGNDSAQLGSGVTSDVSTIGRSGDYRSLPAVVE